MSPRYFEKIPADQLAEKIWETWKQSDDWFTRGDQHEHDEETAWENLERSHIDASTLTPQVIADLAKRVPGWPHVLIFVFLIPIL